MSIQSNELWRFSLPEFSLRLEHQNTISTIDRKVKKWVKWFLCNSYSNRKKLKLSDTCQNAKSPEREESFIINISLNVEMNRQYRNRNNILLLEEMKNFIGKTKWITSELQAIEHRRLYKENL